VPKTTTAQTNWTAGELSPKSMGRFDIDKFKNGAKTVLNWLINQVGGVTFRPGTQYVAEVKTSANATRLIPFQFSTTQSYIVEVGNEYMRFYANQAQVTSGGSAVEIATPYLTADINDLHFAQNADTMYIVHPDYKPRKLQRTSAVTFTLTEVSFVRGPFLDDNITATTITPSADSGDGIVLTASASIFASTHSGALWRIKSGVVLITSVSSGTAVIGNVQAEPDGTAGDLETGPAATTDWAEGAFSGYRGYPTTVTFHEQRLYYANTSEEPQKFWGSEIRTYDSFDAGTAADDNAVAFEIATREVNAIKWLASGQKSLSIGTFGGTFSAKGGLDAIITPDNIDVKLDTNYGASKIIPKHIGGYLYYIQRNLNTLRELGYDYEFDVDYANDATLLADHILQDGSGAKEIAYQQAPNDRLWVVRNDGQIAVMTRNIKQQVLGWSRIVSGSDSRGAGIFESIAVIPQEDDRDEVWVIVKRYINGSYVRYVEFFTDEDFDYAYEPIRLDSALTLDNPKDITAITQADPVVITSASHGFADGAQIKINIVEGMTELNDKYYLVANKTADTFELTDLDGNDIDSTDYTEYYTGGEAREMVTAISGLDHLEGATVSVQLDGGVPSSQQTFTVTSGAITLLQKGAVIHVGLPYTGDLRLLKFGDGSATGTGQTKKRRIYLSTLRVYKSLGITIGVDEDNLNTVYFRAPNDPVGEVTPLFTGDLEKNFSTNWSSDDEILIRQSQPLPLCILAVVFRSEVSER